MSYKIKKTQELIKLLSACLPRYDEIESEHQKAIMGLEKSMALLTGIEDIEIFFCDGEFAGIGNTSRTMELIHRHELEEGKIDEEDK